MWGPTAYGLHSRKAMVFSFRSFAAVLLLVPVLTTGCAVADDDEIGEESGFSDSAITGSVAQGTVLVTTARLNFREGPSKSTEVKRVLAKGARVTALRGGAENGYYKIKSDGEEGFAYGAYLKPASTGTDTDDDDDDVQGVGTGTGAGGAVASSGSCGISFYQSGSQTANGERFNPDGMTAAHKQLKFGTRVRVTNLSNNKQVTVRINDRGPFVGGRCLDLARGAFQALMDPGVTAIQVGVLKASSVKYEVLQ
jgi:rare lipoprotein A (peptidoglycan hydrolase)